MRSKAVFCWSGGKDSSLALYYILQEGKYEVKYLLTTLNEDHKRVSMHGVRQELLEKQAESIGIPLIKMFVKEGTNAEYKEKMKTWLLSLKEQNISTCIFGDIFLEDLRKYREENLKKAGMKGVFPLWKRDTKELIIEFLDLGFKTITCCTNDAFLGEEWVGRVVDKEFIEQLPPEVDPCGENGEYHSFCFEGPVFKNKMKIKTGEKIYKPLKIKTSETKTDTKGFWYCDLLSA